MKKFVWGAALAALLAGCDAGTLGIYVYPQAASVSEQPEGLESDFEVVGYLPSNKIRSFHAEQAQHLTDLVYFTLTPKSDGTLSHSILTEAHKTFLKRIKADYGVRILMGVTDHSRRGALSAIADNSKLRTAFAAALTAFLVKEGFDGADFDWEYPGPGMQDAYAALLREVKEQFEPHALKLTVAVSPAKPLAPMAYASVDRVHGMLYDDAGRHATLENAGEHVEQMVAQGVDPAKLLLGVPFYGRGYTQTGPKWSSAVSYKTLRARYRPGPNQDTVSGYYFNGVDTVQAKVRLARQAGLSGVMIWEIGQDSNDENSLLGAITEARKDFEAVN